MWFDRYVRKITITIVGLFGALLLLMLVGYLVYVRGFGIFPKLSSAASVRVGKKMFRAHWEVKKSMPTPRTEVGAAVANGKIVVVGGLDGLGRTLATVEAYIPLEDKWIALPDLPEPRHHAAVVSYGGILYAIGGMTGLSFTPHASVYALTDGASLWEKRAPLPTPRGALAAAPGDGKIYTVGGVGLHGVTDELAIYYPSDDRWEIKSPALTKREHITAGTIDDTVYVAGGRIGSMTKNLALLEIYDPMRDEWIFGTPLPVARGGLAGTVVENMFLVAGGEQPLRTFSDVDLYDPKGKRWAGMPGLPTPRHGLGVVSYGSTVFAIGGGKYPGLSVSGVNEALYLTNQ